MSGLSFSEFFLLCLIGLIVLGPKRLPQVANQIGNWVGQARRMTRVMKRQLEEELDLDRTMNIRPPAYKPPRDDDTYSPLHDEPAVDRPAVGKPGPRVAGLDVPADTSDAGVDAEDEEDADATAELVTLDENGPTGAQAQENDSEPRKQS